MLKEDPLGQDDRILIGMITDKIFLNMHLSMVSFAIAIGLSALICKNDCMCVPNGVLCILAIPGIPFFFITGSFMLIRSRRLHRRVNRLLENVASARD